MVARQGTERIQDLFHTMMSFGANVEKIAWMFGDNRAVINSSAIPHSTLSKRWNALSYHKVREAVAHGWSRFEWMDGKENPADVMTKPLPWHAMREFVEPLLMWKGETLDTPSGETAGPIPEGSNNGPSSGLSRERERGRREQRSVDARHTIERDGETPIFNLLWNNQCAALADD